MRFGGPEGLLALVGARLIVLLSPVLPHDCGRLTQSYFIWGMQELWATGSGCAYHSHARPY